MDLGSWVSSDTHVMLPPLVNEGIVFRKWVTCELDSFYIDERNKVGKIVELVDNYKSI